MSTLRRSRVNVSDDLIRQKAYNALCLVHMHLLPLSPFASNQRCRLVWGFALLGVHNDHFLPSYDQDQPHLMANTPLRANPYRATSPSLIEKIRETVPYIHTSNHSALCDFCHQNVSDVIMPFSKYPSASPKRTCMDYYAIDEKRCDTRAATAAVKEQQRSSSVPKSSEPGLQHPTPQPANAIRTNQQQTHRLQPSCNPDLVPCPAPTYCPPQTALAGLSSKLIAASQHSKNQAFEYTIPQIQPHTAPTTSVSWVAYAPSEEATAASELLSLRSSAMVPLNYPPAQPAPSAPSMIPAPFPQHPFHHIEDHQLRPLKVLSRAPISPFTDRLLPEGTILPTPNYMHAPLLPTRGQMHEGSLDLATDRLFVRQGTWMMGEPLRKETLIADTERSEDKQGTGGKGLHQDSCVRPTPARQTAEQCPQPLDHQKASDTGGGYCTGAQQTRAWEL